MCRFDETNKVKCEACKSWKVDKLISTCSVTFGNPKDTSKWDSFDYRAGYNMEKAKGERRAAEEALGKGKNAGAGYGADPYAKWNVESDLNKDSNWGTAK